VLLAACGACWLGSGVLLRCVQSGDQRRDGKSPFTQRASDGHLSQDVCPEDPSAGFLGEISAEDIAGLPEKATWDHVRSLLKGHVAPIPIVTCSAREGGLFCFSAFPTREIPPLENYFECEVPPLVAVIHFSSEETMYRCDGQGGIYAFPTRLRGTRCSGILWGRFAESRWRVAECPPDIVN
jgi:hypothetical protein